MVVNSSKCGVTSTAEQARKARLRLKMASYMLMVMLKVVFVTDIL